MKEIDDRDGLSEFVQEISKAMDMLKVLVFDSFSKFGEWSDPPPPVPLLRAHDERKTNSDKSTEWDDIRREKFSLTPPALFTELVRTADSLIARQGAEISRRQDWLEAEVEQEPNLEVQVKPGAADKYGIDLEEFKMKTGRKPPGWKRALKVATWLRKRHMHEAG